MNPTDGFQSSEFSLEATLRVCRAFNNIGVMSVGFMLPNGGLLQLFLAHYPQRDTSSLERATQNKHDKTVFERHILGET